MSDSGQFSIQSGSSVPLDKESLGRGVTIEIEGVGELTTTLISQNPFKIQFTYDGQASPAFELSRGVGITLGQQGKASHQIKYGAGRGELIRGRVFIDSNNICYQNLCIQNASVRIGDTIQQAVQPDTQLQVAPTKNDAPSLSIKDVHPIEPEGGCLAGGFTDIHLRPDNFDRALAIMIDGLAANETEDLIRKIVERAQELTQGMGRTSAATLSVAVRNKDGTFTVGSLGDLPVFLVMQNQNSPHDVKLVRCVFPDNGVGLDAQRRFEFEPPESRSTIDAVGRFFKKIFNDIKAIKSPQDFADLLRGVGAGFGRYASNHNTKFRPVNIDPNNCELHKQGYVCRGVQIFSDAGEGSIMNGDERTPSSMEKTLTIAMQNRQATPIEICFEAVKTAKEHSLTDNTTTVLLLGDGLIALSDGSKSLKAPEAVMQAVREIVSEFQFKPSARPTPTTNRTSNPTRPPGTD